MISSAGQFTALGQAGELYHFRVNQRKKKRVWRWVGSVTGVENRKKKKTSHNSIIRIIMKELSFELFST